MKLTVWRASLSSVVLISGMLLVGVSPASAATPSANKVPTESHQLDRKTWAAVKHDLDSSGLPKSTRVEAGVETTFYTLPSGSMLSLGGPEAKQGAITPQLSTGGCGFLRLCVWLNRGDQMIVAAGGTAALVVIICLAGPAACAVAGVVAAMAITAIQQRGYICPHYMVMEVLFSPGMVRDCY